MAEWRNDGWNGGTAELKNGRMVEWLSWGGDIGSRMAE